MARHEEGGEKGRRIPSWLNHGIRVGERMARPGSDYQTKIFGSSFLEVL